MRLNSLSGEWQSQACCDSADKVDKARPIPGAELCRYRTSCAASLSPIKVHNYNLSGGRRAALSTIHLHCKGPLRPAPMLGDSNLLGSATHDTVPKPTSEICIYNGFFLVCQSYNCRVLRTYGDDTPPTEAFRTIQ
jgi:hypothetical protein